MTVAIALGLTILEFILLSPRAGFAQNTDMANNVEGEQLNSEYKFICENEGIGLSVVNVLQATQEHNTF